MYMETESLNNSIEYDNHNLSPNWFSEQFISQSLIKYLKDNGYKIHKDINSKTPDKVDTIITASKFFSKEVIEVKGFPNGMFKNNAGKELPKNTSQVQQAKNWFSEALLNSFVNFGKYYSNDAADVAIALPNVEKYKAIIEKVQDYFFLNNLNFKIYLVNEDGSVEVSNLNVNYLKNNY